MLRKRGFEPRFTLSIGFVNPFGDYQERARLDDPTTKLLPVNLGSAFADPSIQPRTRDELEAEFEYGA
jgi:hypothetical protein